MKDRKLFISMMVLFTAQIGMTIYIPSLPFMSKDLNVSSNNISLIISIYLLSLGFSEMICGPLSDYFGRRPIFFISQFLYLIGTLICICFSSNFIGLEVGRFIQGLGAGGGAVLCYAILRDSYTGSKLAKSISYLTIIGTILPILSPSLGSWIVNSYNWHAIFIFVFICIAFIFIISLIFLQETLTVKQTKINIINLIHDYRFLFTNKNFLLCSFYTSFGYLLNIISVLLSPFILEEKLNISLLNYGYIIMIPVVARAFGSFVLISIQNVFSNTKIIYVSFLMTLSSGLLLIYLKLSILNFIFSLSLFNFGRGLSQPIFMTELLNPFASKSGMATAVNGFFSLWLVALAAPFLMKHWIFESSQLGTFFSEISLVFILIYSVDRWTNRVKN